MKKLIIDKMDRNQKICGIIFPIICVVMFLCIYAICGIKYAVDDDIVMRNIASGAFTGTPDGHLIFVKYIFGYIVSLIYHINNNIDWYGLSMVGVHFLSLLFLVQECYHYFEKNKLFFSFLALSIFFVIDLNNIVNFQFTTTSAICGATALFLFFLLPNFEVKNKKVWIRICSKIFLLSFISFCVRSEVFLSFCPFAFFIWLYKLLKENNTKWAFKFYMIPLVVISLLMGFTQVIESLAYSSETWQTYKSYNYARSVIFDLYGLPDYNDYKDFYDSIDVSNEEYELYKDWKYDFSSDQTPYKLEKIAEYSQKLNSDYINTNFDDFIESKIQLTLKKSIDFYNNSRNTVVILLYIVSFFCIAKSKNKKSYIFVFSIFLIRELLYFYLITLGRFLDRNLECFILMDLFTLSGFIFNELNLKKIEYDNNKYLINIILIISVLCSSTMYNAYINKSDNNEVSINKLIDYCAEHKENKYVLGSLYTSDNYFFVNRDSFYSNYVSLFGWSLNTEFSLNKKKEMGLNNIYIDLLNEGNYYITFSENDFNVLENYYHSKKMNVIFNKIDEIDINDSLSFKIYEFREK